jgi:hypothetical protein
VVPVGIGAGVAVVVGAGVGVVVVVGAGVAVVVGVAVGVVLGLVLGLVVTGCSLASSSSAPSYGSGETAAPLQAATKRPKSTATERSEERFMSASP